MIATVDLGRFRRVTEEKHVHHPACGNTGDLLVEIRPVVLVAYPRASPSPQMVGVNEREVGSEVKQFRLRHCCLLHIPGAKSSWAFSLVPAGRCLPDFGPRVFSITMGSSQHAERDGLGDANRRSGAKLKLDRRAGTGVGSA